MDDLEQLGRVIAEIQRMIVAVQRRRDQIESVCQDCRLLLKPWPKKKKEKLPALSAKADVSEAAAKTTEDDKELETIDKVLAKADRIRQRYVKTLAPVESDSALSAELTQSSTANQKSNNCTDRLTDSVYDSLDNVPHDTTRSLVINHRSTVTGADPNSQSSKPSSAPPALSGTYSLPNLKGILSRKREDSDPNFVSGSNSNSPPVGGPTASIICKSSLDELLADTGPGGRVPGGQARVTKHFEPRQAMTQPSTRMPPKADGITCLSSNLPADFVSSVVPTLVKSRVSARVPSYIPAHVTAPFKTNTQVYARPRRGEASRRIEQAYGRTGEASGKTGEASRRISEASGRTTEASGRTARTAFSSVASAQKIGVGTKKAAAPVSQRGLKKDVFASGDHQPMQKPDLKAPKKKVAFAEDNQTPPNSNRSSGDSGSFANSNEFSRTLDLYTAKDMNANNGEDLAIGKNSSKLSVGRVAWQDDLSKSKLLQSDGYSDARLKTGDKMVTSPMMPMDSDVNENSEEPFLLTQHGNQLTIPLELGRCYATNRRLREKAKKDTCRLKSAKNCASKTQQEEDEFSASDVFIQQLLENQDGDDCEEAQSGLVDVEGLTAAYDWLKSLLVNVRRLYISERSSWEAVCRARATVEFVLKEFAALEELYEPAISAPTAAELWLSREITAPACRPPRASLTLRYATRAQLSEYSALCFRVEQLLLQRRVLELTGPVALHLLPSLPPEQGDFAQVYRAVYSLLCTLGRTFPTIIADSPEDE